MKRLNRIISIISAVAMLSSSVTAVNAEEEYVATYKIGSVAVNSTPTDWGTNKFGNWSFWAVKEYYSTTGATSELPSDGLEYIDVDNDLDLSADNQGYGTAKINPAGDFTYRGYISSADAFCNTRDTLYGPGIVIAAKPNFQNDGCLYNSDMATYPNAPDDMARFRAGNVYGNHKDVAVMFTVPETGNYNVYLDAVNKGATSNGNRAYGSSNFGRISIIPAGESQETSDNSVDFKIANANTTRTAVYDNTTELQAGTRIFLRMHNGPDMWNDDLFAKFIITRYDSEGNKVKVYDLNQVGYTEVDGLSFMSAEQGVRDVSKHLPLFASTVDKVNPGLGYTGGYAAPTGVYSSAGQQWNNRAYGVYMNGGPNIGWHTETGKFVATTGTTTVVAGVTDLRDIILAWEAPKTGTYVLENAIKAQTTNTVSATFTTTKLLNGTTDETLLSEYELAASATQADNMQVELNEGDKILFRASGSESVKVEFTPELKLMNVQESDTDTDTVLASNARVNTTPEDWGTNKFGNWSFWAVKEYYTTSQIPSLPVDELEYIDVDNDLDLSADNQGYGTAKINPAGDFTARGFLDSANIWTNTRDTLYGPGIVIAAKPNFHNDSTPYNSDMATYPNSADDMVRFRAGNISGNNKDVAVMFTVPETGTYNVYLDAVNKGAINGSGVREYSNNNYGRISIISAGESKETSDNSVNFKIANANTTRTAVYDNTTELQAGTRIFLRMHDGLDMWNDDLFAKFIITRYDSEGNKVKVYDLNQVGYTEVDGLSFMSADKGENDITKFAPMWAAKGSNVFGGGISYTGGYAAPTPVYVSAGKQWNNGTVYMSGTPNIGWNDGEEYFTIRTGDKDAVLQWNPLYGGLYPITVSAYTTNDTEATVSVAKVKAGTTDASDVLVSISADGTEQEENFDVSLAGLDKLVIKITSDTPSVVMLKVEAAAPTVYDYVDIRDFGAVGDDNTDNTTAINDAITFAKSVGVPVYVPAGIFVHNDVIQLDGCKMYGEGFGLSVLKAGTYQHEAIFISGNGSGLYNIKAVGTNGSRNAYSASSVVKVDYATNYEIKNCILFGGSNAGIEIIGGSHGEIANNIISDTAADGIIAFRGANNITVKHNLVYNNRDDAIAFTSFISDGIEEEQLTRDITCQYNTVYSSNSNRGITVNGGKNITIQNNYVNGTAANICIGIDKASNCAQNQEIYVSDNTLKNTKKVSAKNFGGAITLINNIDGESTDIYIYGNDIVNPSRCAFLAYGENNIEAMVYENNIYKESSIPVYVDNDNAMQNIQLEDNSTFLLNQYAQDKNNPETGNDYASTYDMPQVDTNLLRNAEVTGTNGTIVAENLTDGISGTAYTQIASVGEVNATFEKEEEYNTVTIYDPADSVDSFEVWANNTKLAEYKGNDLVKSVYFNSVSSTALKVVVKGTNVTFDEMLVTNVPADVTGLMHNSIFEPWSFLYAEVFYSNDGTDFIYQDMNNFAYAYDFSSFAENSTFISGIPYNSQDRLYNAFVLMDETQESDLTYYGTADKKSKDIGIVTCFTVPENGCYKINWNLINKGQGTGNFARLSVIPKNQSLETSDNTHDIEVTQQWSNYASDILALNKGDKIYTRVYSGSNIKNDEIYGSLKISETTVDGTPLKVYDLNRLANNISYDLNGTEIELEYNTENGFMDIEANKEYSYTVDEEGYYRVVLSALSDDESTLTATASDAELLLNVSNKVSQGNKMFKLESGDTIVVEASNAMRAKIQVVKVTPDVFTQYFADGRKINSITGDFEAIKYIVNPSSEQKEVTVIWAFYDGDKLKNTFIDKDVTIEAGTEVFKTYSVNEDISSYENPKFKMFVWDSMNTLLPYNIATQLN